jgi:hypothetical protein
MTEAQRYFSTIRPEPLPPSEWTKRWKQQLARAMRALGHPETAQIILDPKF